MSSAATVGEVQGCCVTDHWQYGLYTYNPGTLLIELELDTLTPDICRYIHISVDTFIL